MVVVVIMVLVLDADYDRSGNDDNDYLVIPVMIYTIVHGYISLVSSNIVANHRASITVVVDDDDVDTVYVVVRLILYKMTI